VVVEGVVEGAGADVAQLAEIKLPIRIIAKSIGKTLFFTSIPP